jgi:hypothetical protein
MPPPRETERPAATRIFVNLDEPQRIFENAAFDIPAGRATVHAFYGVGGQSKTAPCRELMRKTDVSVERSYSFLRALGAEHPTTRTIRENLRQAKGNNQRDSDRQLLSSEQSTSLSEISRLLD